MTPKQDRGYWRRWGAACKANGWRAEKGYLVMPEPASDPANVVVAAGGILAAREHRAVTLKDLRHGVHLAAVNRHCGHGKLSQKEISRVFALLDLLADPLNLEALGRWTNPEIEAEEREKAFIRSVPAAYVQGVVRKMTSDRTGDWEGLDSHERRALVIILSNARERWQEAMVAA